MHGAGSGVDPTSSPTFRSYLSADWAQWMSEYPETATVFGVPGHNDRWTDESPEGWAARDRHLASSLSRLRAIDPESLSSPDRLSYDLYRDGLESAVAGLAFGDDPLPFRSVVPRNRWIPLNQLEGVQIFAPEILDLQPLETASDLAAYLARLDSLGTCIDQQVALLKAGLAKGYSPPRIAVRGAPDQIGGLLTADPTESPLLRPLAKLSDGIPPGERSAGLERARSTFAESIAPAFVRLREYLEREYLPACRESISAASLPDGDVAYRFRVRWQTTTDLTPEAIHAVGLAEIARIRAEMEAVAKSTGFEGPLTEFNERLKHDPRFCFSRAEELIDAYRAIAKRIDPALPRLFGVLPRLPYGVLPVPDFRARSSPAAYYQPGAPTAGRPGYFFANTYDLTARPRWEMEALALHESVPGHHLQIALGQEDPSVPEFRRFAQYNAFVEGWGLYAESLGEELGMYADPYSKFGQLTFEMWRSIRLVVDTGMHALGWSRERAIEFFRRHTGKSDLDIGVEVDRYIVWPGQALAYKIGQLKIRELRTLAETTLGERFDVRAFHDRLLGAGALPLDLLERRVREWLGAASSARS